MTISLFTPIQFTENMTPFKSAVNFVEDYFYLQGKKASIIEVPEQRVEMVEGETTCLSTALKIASYLTLIIPTIMLLAKLIMRCFLPDYEIRVAPVETNTTSLVNIQKTIERIVTRLDQGNEADGDIALRRAETLVTTALEYEPEIRTDEERETLDKILDAQKQIRDRVTAHQRPVFAAPPQMQPQAAPLNPALDPRIVGMRNQLNQFADRMDELDVNDAKDQLDRLFAELGTLAQEPGVDPQQVALLRGTWQSFEGLRKTRENLANLGAPARLPVKVRLNILTAKLGDLGVQFPQMTTENAVLEVEKIKDEIDIIEMTETKIDRNQLHEVKELYYNTYNTVAQRKFMETLNIN